MLKIGEIVQTLKGIVETKIDMVKQEVQEQFVGIFTRLIILILMACSAVFALLFFSFSLAFYLSTYYSSPFIGFLMVGLLYIIILLILFLARDYDEIQSKIQLALKGFIFKKKIFRRKNEQGTEQEI